MNYEIKSFAPLSVLINAVRIFLIVGFLIAVFTFFIYPNPQMRLATFGQKLGATALFTVVYDVVITIVLTIIALIYNLWTSKFKGVTIRLEQAE